MPNNGNLFRHALAEYLRSWGDGLAGAGEKCSGWGCAGEAPPAGGGGNALVWVTGSASA